MRWLLVLAGALLPAGCSLIVSTSGLTGGAREGMDASTAADVAADTDTADAPISQSESGVEAGAPFCSTVTAKFCDDFDRAGAAKDGWTNEDVGAPGASLALSMARSVSPSTSLRVTHPARPGSASAATFERLDRDVAGTATSMSVGFDVYVEKPAFAPGDSNMGIACFGIRTAGVRDSVCISVGESYIAFGGADRDAIPFDQWFHVAATIDHAGSPTVTGIIAGKSYSGVPGRSSEPGQPDNVDVDIGLHAYNQPVPAFTVFYDNVTLDAK